MPKLYEKAVEIINRYFDTGALLKIYHTETGSDKASALALHSPALPLSFFLEIELRTAMRALRGRGAITEKALNQLLECIDQDIADGRLRKLSFDSAKVESNALNLSAKFTSQILCRSLDIIHVASALAADIPTFVTGDKRQAQLAEAAGLEVEFIEIPRQQ